MTDKIILDLTYKLQHELELMDDIELASFMHDKLIRYDGKLYQLIKENIYEPINAEQ